MTARTNKVRATDEASVRRARRLSKAALTTVAAIRSRRAGGGLTERSLSTVELNEVLGLIAELGHMIALLSREMSQIDQELYSIAGFVRAASAYNTMDRMAAGHPRHRA